MVDEFTMECLAALVSRRITSQDVMDCLFQLFMPRGIIKHMRSDNGPKVAAREI